MTTIIRNLLRASLLAALLPCAARAGSAPAVSAPAPAPAPTPVSAPPSAASPMKNEGIGTTALPPPVRRFKPSVVAKMCALSPLKLSMDRLVEEAQRAIPASTTATSGPKAETADRDFANQVVIKVFSQSFSEFNSPPEDARLPTTAPPGGSEGIKAAYDQFTRASQPFLAEFNQGGKIFPLLTKCTTSKLPLGLPDGALAHHVTLTKLFVLSRHNFTQRANQEMMVDQGSAWPLVSARLTQYSDLARQDLLCCPADSWKEAKKKILFAPGPAANGQSSCSPEEMGQYRKLVNEAFDSLIKPLGGDQPCPLPRKGGADRGDAAIRNL